MSKMVIPDGNTGDFLTAPQAASGTALSIPKPYRRLLAAADYLIQNYLLAEKEDRTLCHSDDHWAAINLVADAVKDAKAAAQGASVE